jgi:hypothetical protein
MSGRNENETDQSAAGDAAELFRRALQAIERRIETVAPEQHRVARVRRLQDSTRLLADSFLAARGWRPEDDEERRALLSEHPLKDEATTRALIDILSLATHTGWTPSRSRDLESLERRYRAALPACRSALRRELPGYESIWALCKRAYENKTCRWLTGLAAGVAVAAAAAYHLSKPQYVFELGGQLFWKHSPGGAFTQGHSRRFTVHVDNAVHHYRIRLPAPVSLAALRLDPVNRVEAREVDILHIQLLGPAGERAELVGNGTGSWSCVNCRWLSDDQRAWRLRPDNDDPHIDGPFDVPFAVDEVRLTMRVSARKTFWEWITRLKRKT